MVTFNPLLVLKGAGVCLYGAFCEPPSKEGRKGPIGENEGQCKAIEAEGRRSNQILFLQSMKVGRQWLQKETEVQCPESFGG